MSLPTHNVVYVCKDGRCAVMSAMAALGVTQSHNNRQTVSDKRNQYQKVLRFMNANPQFFVGNDRQNSRGRAIRQLINPNSINYTHFRAPGTYRAADPRIAIDWAKVIKNNRFPHITKIPNKLETHQRLPQGRIKLNNNKKNKIVFLFHPNPNHWNVAFPIEDTTRTNRQAGTSRQTGTNIRANN